MKDDNFNYAKALKEIEQILVNIQNKEIEVDLLTKEVGRAAELIKKCKQKLRETEDKINDLLEED